MQINDEIPLLLMLIYLLLWVEPGPWVLVSSIEAGGLLLAIYEKDKVRWGVWLGRHICKTITQVS